MPKQPLDESFDDLGKDALPEPEPLPLPEFTEAQDEAPPTAYEPLGEPEPLPLPEFAESQDGGEPEALEPLDEPESMQLPNWPQGSGGERSGWSGRWRDNAARREEWFAARRGEGVERFDVRGGEVVPSTTEQPTAGGESSAEILKRIERQLSSIAEMLRQMT